MSIKQLVPIQLPADPTNALEATTKQYVDSPFGTSKSGVVPASGGGTTNFLRADGTWQPPPAGGTPGPGTVTAAMLANGDFGSFTVASGVATIDTDSVTNTMLAPMATMTLKGNNTGSTAGPTDLTVALAQSMLQVGSSGAFFKFDWSSTTTAPPATSGVRYNNAAAASVTQIYVSYTAKDGIDIKTRLLVGTAGDRLYIQQRTNSAKYQIYSLSGAVTDNTTYATVPVTYQSGGTALANNDEVVMGFIEAPASETYSGIVELATAAETLTGTDQARATHPAGVKAVADTKAPIRRPVINDTTTAFAPVVATHENTFVTLSNAGAITVTMPSNATSAFTIGAEVDFLWLGVGQPTFAAGGGATVNGTPGLKLRARYSAATAKKVATNDWIIIGDLSA